MEIIKRRLNRIEVNDMYYFVHNTHVMECCFCYKPSNMYQFAVKDTHDGCKAWFPFEQEEDKNGKIVAASKNVNWKNYLEQDGNKIIQWLYEGEPKHKGKEDVPELDGYDSVPTHTFFRKKWFDDNYYFKYIGTYMYDYNSSTNERRVSRRINQIIDLSSWFKGEDPELQYQFEPDDKRPYYDYLYINRNYEEHSKLVQSYNKKLGEVDDNLVKIRTICNNLISNPSIDAICKTLNLITHSKYTNNDIMGPFKNESELIDFFQKLFIDVLNKGHHHNELIRNSGYDDKEIPSKLLMLCNPEKYFIYSFSEEEVTKYINKLKLRHYSDDDFVEKVCILYFWNECFGYWNNYEYGNFLMATFDDSKEQTICKIISITEKAPKELIELNEEQEKEDLEDFYKNPPSIPNTFIYEPKPVAKTNKKIEKTNNSSVYDRSKEAKINALVRSNFKCELGPWHKTFISKSTGKPYLETHHLIPMEYYDKFENSLDVESNIVCLCSNCHNEIHYGKNGKELAQKLYKLREKELLMSGLNVTAETIEKIYNK